MSSNYLISDAAKQVNVEAHVLRYWEEELGLTIKRNELGHRFYTEDDVKRFQEIKNMKERGLQLKAIRMILKNGNLEVKSSGDSKKTVEQEEQNSLKCTPREQENLPAAQAGASGEVATVAPEDKAKRLQWLLQQLFRETLQENNRELCQMVKENVLKELDYQFRIQEEKEDERYAEQTRREEEHFKKIDELLRKKRRLLKKS
ncbi:MAG: MerR family transcriptional regulator [Lachnospiraceae bacterium]|nr:MerR family transcriptional regulator [Lachnospiraceae bacterium]